jgi:hypothetical protein
VNQLHGIVNKNEDLKDKIKLIGIGAGNSAFETEIFRLTNKVPFPLFPDDDFSIHNALGKAKTPYFIGVKINGDRTNEVFYSKQGPFGEADEFLQKVLKLSGLK